MAVVQCLTGLWVFEGLHKGVDQGQTARCPCPVYDLPTSLRKAMQNLSTMNSLSNSEYCDLVLRYQLSAMQPPALTCAVRTQHAQHARHAVGCCKVRQMVPLLLKLAEH